MNLAKRCLLAWTDLVVSWPRLVLAIAFLIAAGGVALTVTKLDVITDQLELISKDHPLIEMSDRLDPFETEGKRRFTVAIKAPVPEQAVSFLAELSLRVRQDPKNFRVVFDRVELDNFKAFGLLFLDKQDIVTLKENLEEHRRLIRGFAQDPGLASFFKVINDEMSSRMVGELFTGFVDEAESGEEPEPFDLSPLIVTMEGVKSFLEGKPHYLSPWMSLLKDGPWQPGLEGYFWEGNRRFLLTFVVPNKSDDGILRTGEALDKLREIIRELKTTFPEIEAGVTGQEALNNDEISIVMEDMAIATWISLLGVLFLMILFLRSIRRSLLEIVSLLIGLCWTFGWTTLFIGHLNIISVVFAPLLCGIGVDYGIHWFSRLHEEERKTGGDIGAAISKVSEHSGPGILVAGLSAALSFLPFVLTGFRGLVELGLIIAMGVLFTLIADFSVLPALTSLFRGKPRTYPVAADRNLIRLKRAHAGVILAGAGILTVICAISASRVYFDLNPLRLQTANAESVLWGKALTENSERSALSAFSLASSPEEVRERGARLEALPSVSAVESIFDLLPEEQEEKITLLKSIHPLVPELAAAEPGREASQIPELIDALKRISFKMQDDQAEQWGAEKPLVEQMVQVRTLARQIIETLEKSPETGKKLFEYQNSFVSDLRDKWDFLKEGTNPSLMTIDDLPEVVRDWYFHEGTYLLRIFPGESVWEEHALTRFVRDIQTVDPLAVGDPVSLFVFAEAYKDACIKASIYAIAGIFLLLLIAFRNLSLTFLALVPLTLGTIWTVGIMGFADIQFNLANSIFMPIVVGAGIEYAVIILSRWREGRMIPGHVPLSTGKGVILAALTTTIGFGALMISHHRGIFSLGFVAWAGSLCILACSIIVLPAILAFCAQKTQSGEK
ncbi:MAG: MMPL family transporter [Syntrophobacteraceae bacterium]